MYGFMYIPVLLLGLKFVMLVRTYRASRSGTQYYLIFKNFVCVCKLVWVMVYLSVHVSSRHKMPIILSVKLMIYCFNFFSKC